MLQKLNCFFPKNPNLCKLEKIVKDFGDFEVKIDKNAIIVKPDNYENTLKLTGDFKKGIIKISLFNENNHCFYLTQSSFLEKSFYDIVEQGIKCLYDN